MSLRVLHVECTTCHAVVPLKNWDAHAQACEEVMRKSLFDLVADLFTQPMKDIAAHREEAEASKAKAAALFELAFRDAEKSDAEMRVISQALDANPKSVVISNH